MALNPKGYDPREVAARRRQMYATTGEWVYRREDVLQSMRSNLPIVRDINGNPYLDNEGNELRGYIVERDAQGNPTAFSTLPSSEFSVQNQTAESFSNQGVYTRPSELTEIPTSSTDASRPRTLAAGWRAYQETRKLDRDRRLGTLTVMFRDGTLYNYYDVPYSLWSTFKGSLSKGPYVNKANRNQGSDGPLLAYPRGPANLAEVPDDVREDLQVLARGAQLSFASTNRGRGGYLKPDQRRKAPGEPRARPYVPKSAKYKSGLNPNQRRGNNPNASNGRQRRSR